MCLYSPFRDPSISWYTGEISPRWATAVRSRQFKTPHPITRTGGGNVKECESDATVFLPTRPGLKEEGKTTGPEREYLDVIESLKFCRASRAEKNQLSGTGFCRRESTVCIHYNSIRLPASAGPVVGTRMLVYVSVVVFLSSFAPRILIFSRIHRVLVGVFKYHDAQLLQTTVTSVFRHYFPPTFRQYREARWSLDATRVGGNGI